MSDLIKVLLLDDDEDDFIIMNDMMHDLKEDMQVSLKWISEFEGAVKEVEEEDFDICLVDYRLGEHTGLDFIQNLRKSGIGIPAILLTGQGDSAVDYKAMQVGASDYLIKGEFDATMLGRSIRYAYKRALAIRELNASEKKYRSLFERSVDAIFIINKEHLFIDANRSLEQLLGYNRSEILNMSIKKIFKSKKDYSHFNEMLTKRLQLKNFEVQLCSKDRETLDCIINSVVLKDKSDEVYAFQGIIHDLTDIKKAENELHMAEKMAMTGQIARSIAHEVRNPLTNLGLALEQLKDELENSEEGHMYLDIIKRNAKRIEQLITDLLNSSKPKPLNKTMVNINEVMDETLAVIADRIKLNDIKLVKEFEEQLPDLHADKEQLKTALLNIIINAIESIPKEKQGRIYLKTSLKNDVLSLKIKDNGQGIQKDEIKKMFNPFFTNKKGGMGLGLTTVQNILNSHKAQIDVESDVGEGTTFSIKFLVNQKVNSN
ncbi:MAG: ATP-binding protein [Fulvivirga sp.]|nr:ATP-binding protein [Fulvivirga sp.]